jgi:hypothetical protein
MRRDDRVFGPALDYRIDCIKDRRGPMIIDSTSRPEFDKSA